MFRSRHDFRRVLMRAPSTAASIFDVAAYDIEQTSARVRWYCSPDMNGYVEYGTTVAYGSTTTLETNYLSYHIQQIIGLAAGTEYHYRCVSSDGTETVYSDDFTFTTTAAAVSTGLTYGPANHMDSKDNYRLYGTAESGASNVHSIRWKATTTSTLTDIALAFRYASGGAYSGVHPDWGNVRVRICDDDGSGGPDLTSVLATQSIDPATYLDLTGLGTSGQECDYAITFTSPASLTSGTTYHAVIDNDDPAGGNISINHTFIWSASKHNASAIVRPFGRPSPKWDTADLALVLPTSGNFSNGGYVATSHTPYVDLVYADGTVDGWAINNNISIPVHRNIGGTSNKVRERFTAQAAGEVDGLWARVGLQSGSGDLSIRLEKADGTLVGEGTATNSGTTTTTWTSDSAWDPNGSWVSVSITPATLSIGQEYHLVLSAPAGTQYASTPVIRRSISTSNYTPRAEQFDEGVGEYTTDGGSNWNTMHLSSWMPHAQVFMELT